MLEFLFWISLFAIFYAYFGYPTVLIVWSKLAPHTPAKAPGDSPLPSITLLIPCYNESAIISDKIRNTVLLDYPVEQLEVFFVSDGSTDDTVELFNKTNSARHIKIIALSERKGKANALNQGLQLASSEIIVFSDSSIMLEKDALKHIVKGFVDDKVGCISGEDHIAGSGGEGLYGRYELFLRNKESQVSSIAGASGSFYAQRRDACENFKEGFAPDFLSVLETVEKGYRVITEPDARGSMLALSSAGDEFKRKIRTVLRGMTTLWKKRNLLNPLRYKSFSFVLLSHKIMRWLVPVFMIISLVANFLLIENQIYLSIFIAQVLFYGSALLAWKGIADLDKNIFGKVALYFSIANLAILIAWGMFFRGGRQEIWEPSKRVMK